MSEAGGNVTITATFIKKTYDVNVSESTGGNISLETQVVLGSTSGATTNLTQVLKPATLFPNGQEM